MIGDANVDVAFLLVNGFQQCGAHGIPAPSDIVDDLVSVVPLASHPAKENGSVDTPYTKALKRIALNFPSSWNDATPLDMTALQEQIRNMVSFPDRLTSYCTSLKESTAPLIDNSVYLSKLYDAVWAFCLLNPPCEKAITSSQIMSLLYGFAGIAASRSDCKALFDRLLCISLSQIPDNKCFLRHMVVFTKGILSGSLNRKHFNKKKTAPLQGHTLSERVNSNWGKWMNFLLHVGTQKTEWKSTAARIFVLIALKDSETSCDSSSAIEGSEDSPLFISNEFVAIYVRQFIFREAVSMFFTPRASLKYLYDAVFPEILAAGEKGRELVTGAEECVFKAWDCKDTVLSGTLLLNDTLLNSVVYFMLFWSNVPGAAASEGKRNFPPNLLSFLLNGITLRLDSVHQPLQKAGMVAAAAFAKLFVDSAEAVEGLLKNALFSLSLEEWLRAESGAIQPISRKPTSEATPAAGRAQILQRTAVNQPLRYPVDPDERHCFFVLQDNTGKTAALEMEAEPLAVEQPWRSHFPAFGVQKLPGDGTDIAILQTFRASYDALMGIGRGPNAQQHEVQQSIEAGLEGMLRALEPMKKRRELLQPLPSLTQVDPLIPSLIPTLMLLSIHAPDEKREKLYQKRFQVVVDLIVVSPRASLSQLSTIIYGSNYAIYQRSEMIKAIGQAAKEMSRVVVSENSETLLEKSETNKKRIYPPIESYQLKSRTSLMEGKNTRRWGNAVERRKASFQNRKRYLNLLGNEAPLFFSCLLARLDQDHFKFFQVADPFTPSEVLRTLVTILQSLTRVRHVIVPLCESNLDFFIVVSTQHPHLEIRKQCWVVLGEFMRSWCGAFPVVSLTEKDRSSLSGASTGHESLMLTESWMEALKGLKLVCEEARKKNDPCWGVAAITVASLSDLIQEQSDFDALHSSAANSIRL